MLTKIYFICSVVCVIFLTKPDAPPPPPPPPPPPQSTVSPSPASPPVQNGKKNQCTPITGA